MILFIFILNLISHAQGEVPYDAQATEESLTSPPLSSLPLHVLPTTLVGEGVTHHDVYKLSKKGQYATIPARTDGYDHLSTFCYPSVPLSIYLFWSSASMKMDVPSNNYQVYIGPTM